jgi:hypothetical protein
MWIRWIRIRIRNTGLLSAPPQSLVLASSAWYLPMCNNNLAAPQRELEDSIQPLKKRTAIIFRVASDPDSESGSGSRRAKMTHKNRKKLRN